MRRFRRPSRRRFRRKGSLYEMQEISFARESIVVAGGTSISNPGEDFFELCTPRLEWSTTETNAGTRSVPPIVKGAVLKGIHHRTIISYVPEQNEIATSTSIGVVTVHLAICRLPIDSDGTPLEAPNLFASDANKASGGLVDNKYRTLWRGLEHIRVFDGTVAPFVLNSNFAEAALSAVQIQPIDSINFIRTRSAVRLAMEHGLFLLVQTVSPFQAGNVTLGLDFFGAFGVKNMTRGTTYV